MEGLWSVRRAWDWETARVDDPNHVPSRAWRLRYRTPAADHGPHAQKSVCAKAGAANNTAP